MEEFFRFDPNIYDNSSYKIVNINIFYQIHEKMV